MRLLYCSNNLNFDASFLLFFVKAVLEYFEFISEEEEIWKMYNYYSRNLNFNVLFLVLYIRSFRFEFYF